MQRIASREEHQWRGTSTERNMAQHFFIIFDIIFFTILSAATKKETVVDLTASKL